MSVTPSIARPCPFTESFRAPRENPREPSWLVALRGRAWTRFEGRGLPSSKDEDWRETSLRELSGIAFANAEPDRASIPGELPGVTALAAGHPRLVFLDGHFLPALSQLDPAPEGFLFAPLSSSFDRAPAELERVMSLEAEERASAFRSLHESQFRDGALLHVPAGVEAGELHVCHLSTAREGAGPLAGHPRTVVYAEKGSRATLVETYASLGDGAHLTNACTQIHVEENASVEHYRVQAESENAHHFASIATHHERNARYRGLAVDLGARLTRNETVAVLHGEGADAYLGGLYVPHGEQHVDNHTILDHALPHGDSREVFKGILSDRARAVFSGRIIVREGAQKTDAKQSNPNLLLSPKALAHTRPQLEIYADDVKCTHGATVGRLDEQAIFYLRSRGLPEEVAQRMLIRAFAGELLDEVGPAGLRDWLERSLSERLGATGGSGA